MNDDQPRRPGTRLPRILTEVAVIVGSILLAFGIDAWWEERGEREQEHTLLQNLEAEFMENDDLLGRLLFFHRKAESSGTTLLDISWGREEFPNSEMIDSLLVAVFLDVATFNPSSGTLSSFLATGDPDLIRNERLRQLLLSWPGLVEDAIEDENRVVSIVDQQLMPYLRSQVSLDRVINADSGARSRFGAFEAGPGSEELREILSTREFRNFVTIRVAHERLVQREYGKLVEATDSILTEVRNEIGGG